MAARPSAHRNPQLDEEVWQITMRGIRGAVEQRRNATQQIASNFTPHANLHMGLAPPMYGAIGGTQLVSEGSNQTDIFASQGPQGPGNSSFGDADPSALGASIDGATGGTLVREPIPESCGGGFRDVFRTGVSIVASGGPLAYGINRLKSTRLYDQMMNGATGGALTQEQADGLVQTRLDLLKTRAAAKAAAFSGLASGAVGPTIGKQGDIEGAPQNGRPVGARPSGIVPPGGMAGIQGQRRNVIQNQMPVVPNVPLREAHLSLINAIVARNAAASANASAALANLLSSGAPIQQDQLRQLKDNLTGIQEQMANPTEDMLEPDVRGTYDLVRTNLQNALSAIEMHENFTNRGADARVRPIAFADQRNQMAQARLDKQMKLSLGLKAFLDAPASAASKQYAKEAYDTLMEIAHAKDAHAQTLAVASAPSNILAWLGSAAGATSTAEVASLVASLTGSNAAAATAAAATLAAAAYKLAGLLMSTFFFKPGLNAANAAYQSDAIGQDLTYQHATKGTLAAFVHAARLKADDQLEEFRRQRGPVSGEDYFTGEQLSKVIQGLAPGVGPIADSIMQQLKLWLNRHRNQFLDEDEARACATVFIAEVAGRGRMIEAVADAAKQQGLKPAADKALFTTNGWTSWRLLYTDPADKTEKSIDFWPQLRTWWDAQTSSGYYHHPPARNAVAAEQWKIMRDSLAYLEEVVKKYNLGLIDFATLMDAFTTNLPTDEEMMEEMDIPNSAPTVNPTSTPTAAPTSTSTPTPLPSAGTPSVITTQPKKSTSSTSSPSVSFSPFNVQSFLQAHTQAGVSGLGSFTLPSTRTRTASGTTVTVSPTGTPSGTPTDTPSGTPTGTPTGTPSATSTRTPTGTPTVAWTPTGAVTSQDPLPSPTRDPNARYEYENQRDAENIATLNNSDFWDDPQTIKMLDYIGANRFRGSRPGSTLSFPITLPRAEAWDAHQIDSTEYLRLAGADDAINAARSVINLSGYEDREDSAKVRSLDAPDGRHKVKVVLKDGQAFIALPGAKVIYQWSDSAKRVYNRLIAKTDATTGDQLQKDMDAAFDFVRKALPDAYYMRHVRGRGLASGGALMGGAAPSLVQQMLMAQQMQGMPTGMPSQPTSQTDPTADPNGLQFADAAFGDYTVGAPEDEEDELAILESFAEAQGWDHSDDEAGCDDLDFNRAEPEVGTGEPFKRPTPAPPAPPPPAPTVVHPPGAAKSLPPTPYSTNPPVSGYWEQQEAAESKKRKRGGSLAPSPSGDGDAAESEPEMGGMSFEQAHSALVSQCQRVARKCANDGDRHALVASMGGSLSGGALSGSRAERHAATARELEVAALDALGGGLPFKDLMEVLQC